YEEQHALLDARAARQWAAEAFATAEQQATRGAAAFDKRDFASARSAFLEAGRTLQPLIVGLPQRIATALADGAAALERGDEAAARSAFELASRLDPRNAEAARGLERVASLPAVMEQLQRAQRAEQEGDTAAARAAWQRALTLDADTRAA